MLDTIKVFTDDFRVKDGANLTIQPSNIDYETSEQNDKRLFRNSLGEWVEGAKAFINTDRYNLTIKPNLLGDGIKAFIQFSLPKALGGDNFYPILESEVTQAKNVLADDIANKGILLNLEDCRVSRIDAFKNVYTDENFTDYSPLFSLLRAKRALRRDYGSTFLWANTQREICVYDKIQEIQIRGGAFRDYPQNTTRFEYRLLNARVTKRDTGIEKLRDIDNLDAVRDAYKDALEKHLFSLSVGEIEILASSELENIIKAYKDRGGRYWIREFKENFGAYMVLKMTNLETLKGILERVTDYRMVAWRVIKDFEKSRNAIALMTKASNSKTLSDLYNELKEKVLND